MLLRQVQGLTYDDVLIEPAYSELKSRHDCDYKVEEDWIDEGNRRTLAPIIAANMKTISTISMARALGSLGITVPSHRFQALEKQADFHQTIGPSYGGLAAASVGLGERERIDLFGPGAHALFLELAHCDSAAAIQEIKWIKKEYPNPIIVAGNVATPDACKRLFDAGADIVKVGIGPGAVCTTRLVTGCGVPQLTAVMECATVGPIIADGGIRCSGDIVKALAAGAKYVMIGSLFAGTDEATGGRMRGAGGKIYYGMASREAGKVTNGNVPEGIAATVPYAGSAETVAKELLAGVRQGMAMVGAKTLDELRERAIFRRVSPATIIENQPHISLRV